MKHLYILLALLAMASATFSCIEDDDFDVPETSQIIIEAPVGTVDIQTIVNQYETTFAGRQPEPITFMENAGYIEGYVISSDEGGNFFKELVIQNKAENPTVGVNVKVDVAPLFTRLEFGRRVYVKLDGLTFGEENGVYALGFSEEFNGIQASRLDEYIIRDEETVEIIPKEISASDISGLQENQWVRLVDVQFSEEELGRSFASELGDTFDGDRELQSCDDFFTPSIVYQTSTFADYKALKVPSGRGSVDAIVSRDFRDQFFVLNSNSPEDINFETGNRCAFQVIQCETISNTGSVSLLDETFNTGINNRPTTPAGWTNFIEAGTAQWKTYMNTDRNSPGTRINNFNSGDASSIAWLITPRLDFNSQTGEELEFFTSTEFSDRAVLQVLFSNDWDGSTTTIPLATWLPLADVFIPAVQNDAKLFFSSGKISLNCVDGIGAIAFKYVGNERDGRGRDGQSNGTFELDDVKITSN